MLMPIVSARAMIIVAIHKLIFYPYFKANNLQNTSDKECATDNADTVLFIKVDGTRSDGEIYQLTFCYVSILVL